MKEVNKTSKLKAKDRVISTQISLQEKLQYIEKRNQTIMKHANHFFNGNENLIHPFICMVCYVRVLGVDPGAVNMAIDDISFTFPDWEFETHSWSLVNVCKDSSLSNDETNRCIVHYFQESDYFAGRKESVLNYDFITIELQPANLNIKTTIASCSIWTLVEEMLRQIMKEDHHQTKISLPLVRFVSPTVKINFAEIFPLQKTRDDYSSNYDYNKAISKEACSMILKYGKHIDDLKTLEHNSKKKDDLADVRLMLLGDFFFNMFPILQQKRIPNENVGRKKTTQGDRPQQEPSWFPKDSMKQAIVKKRKKPVSRKPKKQSKYMIGSLQHLLQKDKICQQ